MSSWTALVPFLLVIPISIFTKQVIPGLFVGLLAGSYLMDPSLLGGLRKFLYYLVHNLVQTNNIRIIIFLYVFAGLVSMIKLTGGIKGFVHLVSKKVKTKRSAFMLTWLSTIGTFSDPDFRIVTIAPIMKALKQRLKLSSQELGFAIEATSNPVVALIPIATAFVGYMVSVIQLSLEKVGIHDKPYTVYVKSIPFNFFSIVMILVGIYYSFFKHSKETKMVNTGENPQADQGEEALDACYRAYEKETPIKPWNLILPLATVLTLTLFLSWWDGHFKTKSFFDAFIQSDALGVMLEGLFITLILTIVFFLFQKFKFNDLLTHFVKGGNELMSVIILLALIWGVSDVSEALGFSKFIIAHIGSWIPHYLIAPALFLIGAIISYFIGSSWGTWGLLMPLGVTLAHTSGTNILLAVGAVFSSGTFGAFASPLSDNTNTLCTILDLPIIEYSRYKLVPSLVAASMTTILFGVASFLFR
ncbi:Na+/H+ antiporter NhaC family protein [Tepidibacillus fermentans]|uniref:Transporter (NhaC family) n=1 Tax=Tepidibacillus fermentans TaxID=1281767 RepID=A0A4R3KIN9_9BACI|nr:Na+/H+ antiporter NhaC family protein [Tepidibacillus fermentans]TCS83144.1 transporter (NhaC family) [Tepidibacillus fermentans]